MPGLFPILAVPRHRLHDIWVLEGGLVTRLLLSPSPEGFSETSEVFFSTTIDGSSRRQIGSLALALHSDTLLLCRLD